MGAINRAILVILLGVAASYYVFNEPTEVPELPETWWRPGNEKTVDTSIRSTVFDFPAEMIKDLKHRLQNTRALTQSLNDAAWTYGMNMKALSQIIDYWQQSYDFKKREAVLNQYPHFITNIQGLDIHFLHIKPKAPQNKKVLPLLLQHGWPGSIVEFYKIIPLLTTPRPEHDFVFEVVAPSLPGFGLSDAATIPGLGQSQMAVVLKNLMLRLGHEKFYTQGGDWGAIVTADLAAMFPQHVLGMHSNMCSVLKPLTLIKTLAYSLFPSLLLPAEDVHLMYPLKTHWSMLLQESGYFHIQATKPDTVGVGLNDSPAGLAAYILEKFSTATNVAYRTREDGGLLEKFTMDELLDNVMVYWRTNSAITAARIYAESFGMKTDHPNVQFASVMVPSACAQFPNEISYQPAQFLKDRFKKLVRATKMPRGGHFAAMEEPQLLADDIWASVKAMREVGKVKS